MAGVRTSERGSHFVSDRLFRASRKARQIATQVKERPPVGAFPACIRPALVAVPNATSNYCAIRANSFRNSHAAIPRIRPADVHRNPGMMTVTPSIVPVMIPVLSRGRRRQHNRRNASYRKCNVPHLRSPLWCRINKRGKPSFLLVSPKIYEPTFRVPEIQFCNGCVKRW